MKKIAVVDFTSRALPYDFYYIKSLSKYRTVDFYCSQSDFNGKFIENCKQLNNVNVFENRISGKTKPLAFLLYFMYSLKILFSSKKYEKINLQWLVLPIVDLLLFSFIRSKIVLTVHNTTPHGSRKKISYATYISSYIFPKLLFVSESEREKFERLYLNYRAKLYVLPHGMMDINPSFQSVNVDRKKLKRIVFWGTVKDYKGIDFIFDSIDVFDKIGLELEIHGKFDKDKEHLVSKFKDHKVRVVNGYLDDDAVSSLLSSNNLALILPYKNATQSGVLYTALAYNVPLLGSNSGDTKYFISSYLGSSFTFSYGNKSELENALIKLKSNYSNVSDKMKSAAADFNWSYDEKYIDEIF